MKAVIEINMDGDAFAEVPSHELARLLGRLEHDVVSMMIGEVGHHSVCVDYNGNTVGKLEIVEGDEVVTEGDKKLKEYLKENDKS